MRDSIHISEVLIDTVQPVSRIKLSLAKYFGIDVERVAAAQFGEDRNDETLVYFMWSPFDTTFEMAGFLGIEPEIWPAFPPNPEYFPCDRELGVMADFITALSYDFGCGVAWTEWEDRVSLAREGKFLGSFSVDGILLAKTGIWAPLSGEPWIEALNRAAKR